VTVANGGTGATTAAQALTNLGAAGLAAPAFTGAPTAPTAAPGTNTTQLSTTAFVQAAVATAGGAFVPLSGSVPMSGGLTVKLNSATLPVPIDPAQIHIGAADATHARFTMDTFGTGAYPAVEYKAARGTGAAPAAVQANDILGVEIFRGYGGGAYAMGAQIYAVAAENWTATGHGTFLNFVTTAPGTTSPIFPLSIGQGMLLGVPTTKDPGAGSISIAGNYYMDTNGAALSGRDTGGVSQILIQLNTGNNVVIGYGNVTSHNGHLVAAANNLFLNGNTGTAWSNVVAYAITNLSDVREKTDIADLPDCLGLIQQITPKRYKFTHGRDEDKDRVRWGLIAQDVEGAMKKAGHDFGGHIVGDDEKKTQGLSYSDLTAVLWKAVQELAGELAELKAKVQQ
jgi:hypothetical protein